MRSDTLRLLFAGATVEDWDIHGLDVASAFLHGEVEEEMYMRQIPGYEDGTDRVLRIRGSLYGLRQAPRIWEKLFLEKVSGLGYHRIPSDSLVYIRKQDGVTLILAVYVDDIAIFTTKGHVEHVKKELMGLFEMRDLGELSEYLGFKITRNREEGTLSLTQPKYLRKIVEKMGLANANPVVLPMTPGTQLRSYSGEKISFPYAEKIGELLYAALGTRPDIAFAVQHLSQFTKNPGPEHVAAVKHLYRFILGTPDDGITYRRDKGFEIRAYTDADWAQNVVDRKSISGHVFTVAGGAISWGSKKQSSVALSSLEAEYVSLSLATRHCVWLRQLVSDIHLPLHHPIAVWSDSASALALARDDQFHGRSKHIDVRHHFVRECVERSMVALHHIPGESNPADALTKALPRPRWTTHITGFMQRLVGMEADGVRVGKD